MRWSEGFGFCVCLKEEVEKKDQEEVEKDQEEAEEKENVEEEEEAKEEEEATSTHFVGVLKLLNILH